MKILEYKPIKINLDDLKYDETNPNEMNEEQMNGLRESMTRFGYLTPIVIGQNNMIADGEHRAKVYKEFNKKEILAFKVHFKDDNERKMLRQTMNKLRGIHDPVKDAIEIAEFFKDDTLHELSILVGQDQNELKRFIADYHPDESILSFHKHLDENVAVGFGSLAKNWGIPPFSVLDRRSETWQARRYEWLKFGIASEQGREDVVLYANHINVRVGHKASKDSSSRNYLPTASVYDPVLAEISIRWFCIPNVAQILDPFAGGSVRGIVSSFLGHHYTGIDLSPNQITANEKQYSVLKDRMPSHHKPLWIAGDSFELDKLLPKDKKYDFVLTSPPYFQVEKYSDSEKDLNNMSWKQFSDVYTHIIKSVARRMKKNSFIAWNVGNARDKKTGFYVNQNDLTKEAFAEEGFGLQNELVVVHPSYSLPFRVNNMFVPKRTVPKQHEFLLIFYNGTKESIKPINPRRVEIPQTEYPIENKQEEEIIINEE